MSFRELGIRLSGTLWRWIKMPVSGVGKGFRCGEIARVLLGALFLTAGLAKVPVLREFGVALESIVGLGPTAAFWGAAGVLGVEVVTGTLLVLGIQRAAAALCGLVMGGVFAGVQFARLLRGAGPPCHCLGVLGNLPGGVELGLDVLLLVLAIAVLRARGPADAARRVRVWYVLLAALVPASALTFRFAVPDTPHMTRGGEMILQRLKAGRVAGMTLEREVVIFLNPGDFRCSICFEDLISLLDTIQSIRVPGVRKEVAAALRLTGGFGDSAGGVLRRWARETGFAGPIAVVSGDEFDDATGGKSVLWITDGLDRVMRIWEFPLGPVRRGDVIASLTF